MKSLPVIVNQVPIIENGEQLGTSFAFVDVSDMELMAQELEIVKDLTEYNASLKDALFVFQVEGTRNGEQVYSDVVSIKFNQAGEKSVLVKDLPAGTVVTVKEVYAGGSYSNTSGDTQEAKIVAEGVTDNPASVSFTNTYNGKLIPGTGIVNHFENKDGEWSWEQQTDEPASAN